MELKLQPACGTLELFRRPGDFPVSLSAGHSKPYKFKGFTNDIIMISCSSSDQADALRAFTESCTCTWCNLDAEIAFCSVMHELILDMNPAHLNNPQQSS